MKERQTRHLRNGISNELMGAISITRIMEFLVTLIRSWESLLVDHYIETSLAYLILLLTATARARLTCDPSPGTTVDCGPGRPLGHFHDCAPH